MVSTRRSNSLHVPTIAGAASPAVFDDADAQGVSTEAASEASEELERAAIANTAPPRQEHFSAAPDPYGAESHARSDTSPPLEAYDDEVIQVDDDVEDSLPDDSENEHY